MPEFYTTNAVCEYIMEHNIPNHLFAKGDLWMLVYGDAQSMPRLLLVVSAVPEERYASLACTPHEKEVMELCARFAAASGLEYRVIRYREDVQPISTVQYMEYRGRCEEVTLPALRVLFVRNGITSPFQKDGTRKAINDRASSNFHAWQRASLGESLVACDIDLIKFNAGGRPTIYELKRSFKPVEEWNPYYDDIANYRLMARFAGMVGAGFQVVYNRRIKTPFFDDISRLKRFSIDPEAEENWYGYLDTITPEEFFGDGANG